MKKLILPSLLLGALLTTSASAQTRTKADNTNALNQASSYVENTTIPNSTITLIVDNTLTTSRTSSLGGNVSVLGITMSALPVSGSTRQFQINSTAASTLTIFGGGITKDANTSALIINSAVALGANQTWTLNASSGAGTGNFQLNTTSFDAAGFNLAINGGGILDLRPAGSLTLGPTVTIDTAVSVNSATAAVTLGGTNTFDSLGIVSGKASGATFGNFGTASNFGDGGTNTVISLGGNNSSGTFEYTGATASSNRTFNMDRRSNGNSIVVTEAASTLTISGTISNSLGNATGEKNVALTVGGAGNTILSGVISNHAGSGAGFATSLVKNDGGTLTLSNANTFAGGVTVNAGTLLVNNTTGSGTGSGSVVIESGATLGGTGAINGATTINGILAPGNSIGTLNVNNTVTWNDNDAWKFDLGTSGVSMLTSGTSDLLNIVGGSFTKGTGSSFTFDFLGSGQLGWYKLVDWTVDTTFVAGDFGATNLASGYSANFIVDGGTSALYLEVIPEPSTWALFALGGTALVVLRRRRARF